MAPPRWCWSSAPEARVERTGRCLMPRNATATSQRHDDEATMTHVDELIQRGRSQGNLSLPELRTAFEQARISPTEARSIVRELTEAGVQLGTDQPAAPAQAAHRRAGGRPGQADRGRPVRRAQAGDRDRAVR